MPDERSVPVDSQDESARRGVSRRSFIQTLGASAATSVLANQADANTTTLDASVPVFGPGPQPVALKVNGKTMERTIDPATTLLEALRIDLSLTGSKEICDRGSCGGCSVLVDGQLTASCMMLANDAVGSEVTTVEGLSSGDSLSPLQESFVRHDALQCGFCTPGLVVACQSVLNDHPKPSLDQIKKGISGNICRCGTYTNIFNAVLEASGQKPLQDRGGPQS
jgi:aerobic-type carbon monoxide dehydrogenase small subunit (CoxS/CutS family)